jgi:hypothetical protein
VKQVSSIAIAVWVVLLFGVLGSPWFLGQVDPGDDLVRNTIRLSLAFYAVTIALMLFLRPAEWTGSGRGELARWCWSLAWAAYVIHVGMAFHFYHGWSHADAIRHTEEVSGFGPGIYVSHLFTLLWTADVAWWWLRPLGYARRPVWFGRTLHAFMVFIALNGTVVYETGPIRWAGVTVVTMLAALWLYSRSWRPALDRVST